jgi:hypothetical protein
MVVEISYYLYYAYTRRQVVIYIVFQYTSYFFKILLYFLYVTSHEIFRLMEVPGAK